jgi:glycerate kinase
MSGVRVAPGRAPSRRCDNARVHVVIAPDCFTGTLTAQQAAQAIADGWRQTAPHDLLTLLPLSDGGPGFLDVLGGALPDAETLAVTVADPLGREVPAAVLVVEDGSGRTAYVESAQSAGLHLLDAGERDPSLTSTWGVGQLLEAALTTGATRIVVGLGGSSTNDGGAGLLAALGVGRPADLARGGLSLGDLGDDGLSGLDAVRERFASVELVLASDVESPLLGLQGASAVFAPQKGASPELAQALEGAMGRYVEVVRRTLPETTDLLTGKPVRLDKQPGAGAAGGLGYALYLLGGRRVSGVGEVLAAVGFPDLLAAADLVVTGEGSFDWQSLQGKVVAGVATVALETATPSIVIAGQTLVGRREAMTMGLSGTYAVATSREQVEAAMADPVGTLAARAARVAATWSPQR